MGANKEKAQEFASAWWNSESSRNSRDRGYAVCDQCSGKIPCEDGFLCNPTILGDHRPSLVCAKCFDRLPFQPWHGGYSAVKRAPRAPASMILECPHCRQSVEVAKDWAGATIACPYKNCTLEFFVPEELFTSNPKSTPPQPTNLRQQERKIGFFKKFFRRLTSAKSTAQPGFSLLSLQKPGHVRCPHCGSVFRNTISDNSVDQLIHGLLSSSGKTDTSEASRFMGLDPSNFKCPACKRSFTL